MAIDMQKQVEAERIAAALGGSWFVSSFEALTLKPPALPEDIYPESSESERPAIFVIDLSIAFHRYPECYVPG